MKIKPSFIFSILFFVTFGSFTISAQNTKTKKVALSSDINDLIHITDHKNFSLTFTDVRFYEWLAKQSPKHKYLQSSLEIENIQYVTEWNRRVENSKYDANLYNQLIDYTIKPRFHYGLDVNYELYMYFKFFEEKYEKILLKT